MTRPVRSVAVTVSGAVAVAGVLGWALAGRRDEFAAALDAAPLWLLLTATGTVGALCFATWAALDRLRPVVPSLPSGPGSATTLLADTRSA